SRKRPVEILQISRSDYDGRRAQNPGERAGAEGLGIESGCGFSSHRHHMYLQLGRTSESLARATAVKGRNSKKIQCVWKASSVKRDFNVQRARKRGAERSLPCG